MIQFLARLIGTIVSTWLLAHHVIPASFGWSAEDIADLGLGIIFVLSFAWGYLERFLKGQITWYGKAIPQVSAPAIASGDVTPEMVRAGIFKPVTTDPKD